MLPRVLVVVLLLLPALARADVPPDETTTGTTGATDGTTTDVPPPEYTPCGCGAERSGGAWAALLTLTAAGWCRRRRARA